MYFSLIRFTYLLIFYPSRLNFRIFTSSKFAQISECESVFETFVLHSYPIASAFVFVFEIKCGK